MINHLWQSTWFALAAGALTLAFRGNRASVRYWLWFAASLKFLIPFVLLVDLGSRVGQPVSPAVIRTMHSPLNPVMMIEPFPNTPPIPRSATKTVDWTTAALLGAWTLGSSRAAGDSQDDPGATRFEAGREPGARRICW